MTTGSPELDADTWQLYSGLHRLLLRLAGQVPDELETHARTMLGTSDLAYLPDTVAGSAAELGVSLTAPEADLLRRTLRVLDVGEDEPAGLGEISISPTTPPTGYRFAPVSPRVLTLAAARIRPGLDLTRGAPADLADLAEELRDLPDDLVVDALTEHDGVVAIWRGWRFTPDWSADSARRVYLAEVGARVPAWELTYEAQEELGAVDEESPQVEVYWAGDELSPYHQAARANAALLWAR